MENQENSESRVAPVEITTEDSASVSESTNQLVEKHRRKTRSDKGQKRGPRGSSTNSQAQTEVASPNMDLQLNIELVKKTVTAVTKAIDGVVVRKVNSKALSLGCDENLAKAYAHSAGLTTDELTVISECSAISISRSEFLMKHAPEAMLLLMMANYGIRVTLVLGRLDAMERKLAKMKKAGVGDREPKPSVN